MRKLIRLHEPMLLFRHGQAMEDPRDGLTLFGPLDEGRPYGIHAGVIGTKGGIARFKQWVDKIQGPISNNPPLLSRPPFPGFEAIFRIPWKTEPVLEIEVSEEELNKSFLVDDKHQRVYKTVDVFSGRIAEALRQQEEKVDIWFVMIPDEVYKYCRPKSSVEKTLQIDSKNRMSLKQAKNLLVEPSLFQEENLAATPYYYEVDFHNQLKARLLEHKVPVQIIRESTIAHLDFLKKSGKPKRDLDKLQSAVAWNIATTAFYKTGGRPWKLGSIREGVCYIGLVFKRDDTGNDEKSACCAAQMFLDSGDGVVFKGAVGPWYNSRKDSYHLRRDAAKELVSLAVNSYKKEKGVPPKELFLHGRVRFDDEEWKGFQDAVDSSTNLVGIRIKGTETLKLYRKGDYPILRGLAFLQDKRNAYLWTKGFIPRLQTAPVREVPNPLLIEICRGDADMETVLNDIMSLTKLNYNACIFSDGLPITLKFADAVGEILTAAPLKNVPPLPFKYYI